MPRALACRDIHKQVIELHRDQGLNPQEILQKLEGQVSRNTAYRWVREWKAEQQKKAQTAKEVA